MNFGLKRHEDLNDELVIRLKDWYDGKLVRSLNPHLNRMTKLSLDDRVLYEKGEWDAVLFNDLNQIERLYEVKGRHSNVGFIRAYDQLLRGAKWCFNEYGFKPHTIYVSQNPKINKLIVRRVTLKDFSNKRSYVK